MSMQKVSVLVPPMRQMPRGAVLVGFVVDAVLGAERRLRKSVEAWRAAARSRRAIARVARRDARDRAQLTALAHRFESSQPEFAKDLFAAAKRDSA